MTKLLAVGIGGFVGSVGRYAIGGWVQQLSGSAGFPYGTLAVNVLGCAVIGVLMGLAESRALFGPETRLFLMVGVCGGFTTFSTFGYETFALMQDRELLAALANVAGQVVLGFAAVYGGVVLSRVL